MVQLAEIIVAARVLRVTALLVRAEVDHRTGYVGRVSATCVTEVQRLALADKALCQLARSLGRLEADLLLARVRQPLRDAAVHRDAVHALSILCSGREALSLAVERLQDNDLELLRSSRPVLDRLLTRLCGP